MFGVLQIEPCRPIVSGCEGEKKVHLLLLLLLDDDDLEYKSTPQATSRSATSYSATVSFAAHNSSRVQRAS